MKDLEAQANALKLELQKEALVEEAKEMKRQAKKSQVYQQESAE